jgi:hypothetical protein
MLGLSIPSFGTRTPPELYELFVSKNTQQHAKSSQSETNKLQLIAYAQPNAELARLSADGRRVKNLSFPMIPR